MRASSFVVIGLGTLGATVALELARLGDHILGIDIDGRNVGRVADDLSEAIVAGGRNEDALRHLGGAAIRTGMRCGQQSATAVRPIVLVPGINGPFAFGIRLHS
ncbi:hypothetical protein EET67_22185 [Pseudaminobacter arsenicus]|uniref:RCK N-terminal domain-containing protein n=2 Tax=Borborobacter arsenicus TaxID=1851146 RepID=A0A432V0C9_9HYPH|nr:NAD-binding protein [Pseudaminobacter arsenicus]RUM95664.1 hypothetical protein EET67_22185 [Pseudaminobacter arsenicus]